MSKFIERLNKMPPEKRLYTLEMLPSHLAKASQAERLRELLTNFRFLEAKIDTLGPEPMITDYDLALSSGLLASLEETKSLKLIQGTLRLSAHILKREEKDQLAGQLLSRLRPSDGSAVQILLAQAKQWTTEPWLHPLKPMLTLPSSPLLRTLTGHIGDITRIVVTTDGQRVISASRDRTIRVWNLETGVEEYILRGHTDVVNDVAVTEDGQWALSASNDHTIKVWNLAVGAEADILTGHTDAVHAVAVSANGRWAISASKDDTLKVWDLATRAEVHTFDSDAQKISAIAITRDGRRAVSGSFDQTLKVWNLVDRKLSGIISNEHASGHALTLIANGRLAISVGYGLTVWDIEGRKVLTTIRGGHTSRIRGVALIGNGRRVVTASIDGTLRVLDLTTVNIERVIHRDGVEFWHVAVTMDGRQAVSASPSDRGALQVWDLSVRSEKRTLNAHSHWVNAIVAIPNAQHAISASEDGTLKVWNVMSGVEMYTLRGHTSFVWGVAVTRNGQRAISASPDGTLKVWNLTTGTEERTLISGGGVIEDVKATAGKQRAVSAEWDRWIDFSETLLSNRRPLKSVTVTANEQIAISGDFGGRLTVWNLATGQEIHSFSGRNEEILNAVAVTEDNQHVISASEDGTLKVWDLATGTEQHTLTGHRKAVNAVAVLPDGRHIISASADGIVGIWDLETGVGKPIFTDHRASVNDVAVTADGRRAISASDDHTLKVWSLKSGTVIASFVGEDPFRACAIASDGVTIVAGDQSGKVHFLRLEGVKPLVRIKKVRSNKVKSFNPSVVQKNLKKMPAARDQPKSRPPAKKKPKRRWWQFWKWFGN